MAQQDHDPATRHKQERWSLLEQINAFTDNPFIALSFVWLGLLIVDFTRGLGPVLQTISNIIWALFITDFLIEIIIAPHKGEYLRRNWLTVVSLLLPALRIIRVVRVVRVLRAARAARSLRLLRLVTSLNRGMRAIGKTLGQRGIGYVLALTTIVTFAGAAGMYAFESPAALREAQLDSAGLPSYGEALWWTAMLMTTMGSEYWPRTGAGRVLGLTLAVYAFTIFGYITATIATHFIGKAQEVSQIQPSSDGQLSVDVRLLREEVVELRREIALLLAQGKNTDALSSNEQV